MSIKTDGKKTSNWVDWFEALDRILRGRVTQPEDLKSGDIRLPLLRILAIIVMLATLTGLCMGTFSLIRGVETGSYIRALLQTSASMAKVPLLFLLTLMVTFPPLYVFNALVGSQLRVLPVLKLLVASLAVNLAVLASMGPIVAFFSASTPNYHFIVLLNVLVFAMAGGLGLAFLVQSLNRMTESNRGNLPANSLSVEHTEPATHSVVSVDQTDEVVDGHRKPSLTR